MPPKKMDAKIAALENEVAGLKNAFMAMQMKAEENQEPLIALLTKNAESDNGGGSGTKKLQGDSLE